MGDYFQKFAAPGVTRSNAAAAAARVRTWLQEEKIIASEPSDCVLGNPNGGYRPGLGWHKAVAPQQGAASGHDASGEHVKLTYATDGVEIIDIPTAYWTTWSSDPFVATCPSCRGRCASAFVKKNILQNIQAWLDGDGTVHVTCPHCGSAALLPSWRMEGLVLAHFGLVFWNWLPIADQFVGALAREAGSEIITLSGKL